jgi:hypothetical protein
MTVNAIENRQNEERMLRYQFAARVKYNRAEVQNDLVWLCCFISWLTIFLPHSFSREILFIAMPFWADMIATILNWRMTVNVFSASKLRKYFDAYVLRINMDEFSKTELQELEELSIKVIKQYPEKSKEQTTNTGRDDPPGIRNWYEFSQPLSEHDAIYECQKQNCWWNKKITHKRLVYTGIGLLVFIPLAIFFMMGAKTEAEILQIIFSSGGLITKCTERLIANGKYYMVSLKIDGALDVLENSRTGESMKKLQAEIDIRRAMPVLERNYIHKRLAKVYSELYHDISAVKK